MRLTLVIAGLTSGGAERVLSGLANHWSNQGHDVTLVTLSGANDIPFYPLSGQVKVQGLNAMLPDGVGGVSRLVHMFKRVMTLRRALKQSRPDVVVSFVDITNLTTLLASLGTGLRVVVSERTHPAYHHISSLYVRLRFFLYRMASCVVVQTQSAAVYFGSLKRVCVIPNAVGLPLLIAKINDNVRRIVSVGRLCQAKGFGELIQAFSNIVGKYPHVELTIYGEGEDRSHLENFIQDLGLDNKVHLPGAVANVTANLGDADLFVFPSHYEGFPNALCEAMAAGLPVIASNCSGNVDIVRDGVDGLLFPIGNVEMLTSLMLGLMSDKSKRKSLGEHATTIVQRFDQKSVLTMWDNMINEGIKI